MLLIAGWVETMLRHTKELREHDVSELCKIVTSTGCDSEEGPGTTVIAQVILGQGYYF